MKDPDSIYRLYAGKIYNLAYRMTGNKEDARDITQETFFQAFRSINTFKGKSEVYTWLYRIAKNNCIRFLEKKKKTSFLDLHTLSEQVSSPVSEEISESVKQQFILQVKDGCLSGMMRCLSIQQRLAFIMHILMDLPVSDVALIIEKSENATRILIHRARHNIRNYLCENCSLYNSKNSCRCENLINFSLKHNWIGRNDSEYTPIYRAEKEISEIKDEVALFKTLKDKEPEIQLGTEVKQLLISKEDFLILKK